MKTGMLRPLVTPVAGALALAGCGSAGDNRVACDALTAVTSDSTTITSAQMVSAPATISGVTVEAPFCRVQGTSRPSSGSRCGSGTC